MLCRHLYKQCLSGLESHTIVAIAKSSATKTLRELNKHRIRTVVTLEYDAETGAGDA